MPGRRERERELARRRYERRRQRELARRARRRQLLVRGGVIATILAVLAGFAFGISTAVGGGGSKHKLTSTPSVTPTTAAPTPFNGNCTYNRSGTAARSVGVPAQHGVTKRNYVAKVTTNRGVITIALNGTAAPCTVNSFVYLATKHYFDRTNCHRLTTQGIYVLQCGDPTGTGGGGPGYQFGDENLTAFGPPTANQTVTYPTATVAMANAGPGTNGSQFFLVYAPSPLQPAYTPFGQITSGLSLLKTVAAKGSTPAGDGKPKDPVVIEQVVVRAS